MTDVVAGPHQTQQSARKLLCAQVYATWEEGQRTHACCCSLPAPISGTIYCHVCVHVLFSLSHPMSCCLRNICPLLLPPLFRLFRLTFPSNFSSCAGNPVMMMIMMMDECNQWRCPLTRGSRPAGGRCRAMLSRGSARASHPRWGVDWARVVCNPPQKSEPQS